MLSASLNNTFPSFLEDTCETTGTSVMWKSDGWCYEAEQKTALTPKMSSASCRYRGMLAVLSNSKRISDMDKCLTKYNTGSKNTLLYNTVSNNTLLYNTGSNNTLLYNTGSNNTLLYNTGSNNTLLYNTGSNNTLLYNTG